MLTLKEFIKENVTKRYRTKGLVHDDYEASPEEKEDIYKDRIKEHNFSKEDRHEVESALKSQSKGSKDMDQIYRQGSDAAGDAKVKHSRETFKKLFDREKPNDMQVPAGHVLYHGTNRAPHIDDTGHMVRNHLISTTAHFHEAVNHAAKGKSKEKDLERDPEHHVIAIHHNGKAPAVNISDYSLRSKGETEVTHAAAKFKHIGTTDNGKHPDGKTIKVHHFEVAYPNPRHSTHAEMQAMGMKELTRRREEFLKQSSDNLKQNAERLKKG